MVSSYNNQPLKSVRQKAFAAKKSAAVFRSFSGWPSGSVTAQTWGRCA